MESVGHRRKSKAERGLDLSRDNPAFKRLLSCLRQRDGLLPMASETPLAADNMELVSRLIVANLPQTMLDLPITHPADAEYQRLLGSISEVYSAGQLRAVQAVNAHLRETYWQIGHDIIEFEQDGKAKAEYGKGLLTNLSRDLTRRHGKGFSRSNLSRFRQFYLAHPICAKASHKLSWSHYSELLKLEDPLERSFYARQAMLEKWSVPELQRKKNSFRADLRITEILGRNCRSSEQALKELVDHAWDADATKVLLTLPDPMTADSIVITDNGSGMTAPEVEGEYLHIG